MNNKKLKKLSTKAIERSNRTWTEAEAPKARVLFIFVSNYIY